MESLYLLTGENGCGKDFFFKNIHSLDEFYTSYPNIDTGYKRLSFADPIKISLGVAEENLTQSGLKRSDIINRANEIKQKFGEDVFVDIVISKKLTHVVITDLRFENELKKIKSSFSNAKVIAITSNPHNFEIDLMIQRIQPISD